MDLNKIIISTSLLLSQPQFVQPSNNSIFQIKVTANDFKNNLSSSVPFRTLMIKNTANNLYNSGSELSTGQYQKASESILFAVCSALTACFYPENGSWGYEKKMTTEQKLIMSAICIASCGNSTFNTTFKGSENLELTEKLISGAICTMPFFYSFTYFALNINK